MNWSEIIKNKRLELHESQKEFGKRFGITHAAISDIERDVRKAYPTAMIEFVLNMKYKVTCPICHGDGFIEEIPIIKAL